MRIVWTLILSMAVFAACVESEPWPETEMDARNFPKESTSPEDTWIRGTCGDNVVNAPGTSTLEDCDGMNLAGETCVSLGYDGGELSCHSNCTFETLECEGGTCGNGFVDVGETCDVRVIDGVPRVICPGCERTRQRCTADCQLTNTGGCGDGRVQAPSEECDGEEFAPGATSWNQFEGYDVDTLGCMNCRIDVSDATPATCGNGVLERDEDCEPGIRSTWDFPGSERRACVDCRLQDDPSFCGDGVVDRRWYEECEGDASRTPCSYQPDREDVVYVPCVNCTLRPSRCPAPPPPIPTLDAGSGEEDAIDTVDGGSNTGAIDDVSSGAEPDTSGPQSDVVLGTDTDEDASGSDGCSAAMVDSDSRSTWLLLLFALLGIRRQTTGSRESLCASSGSYSSL